MRRSEVHTVLSGLAFEPKAIHWVTYAEREVAIHAERDVFLRLPMGSDMSHCYCLSLGTGPENRSEMGVVTILLSQLTKQILLVYYQVFER